MDDSVRRGKACPRETPQDGNKQRNSGANRITRFAIVRANSVANNRMLWYNKTIV